MTLTSLTCNYPGRRAAESVRHPLWGRGAWQPLSGWHTKHDYVPDLRIADNRLGMGLFLVAAYHRAR